MTEPTSEEIDRVARAICAAESNDPRVYAAIDENDRNGYRWMARAAILALRRDGEIERGSKE